MVIFGTEKTAASKPSKASFYQSYTAKAESTKLYSNEINSALKIVYENTRYNSVQSLKIEVSKTISLKKRTAFALTCNYKTGKNTVCNF